MKLFFRLFLIVFFLPSLSCADPPRSIVSQLPPSPTPPGTTRQIIIFIPRSDQAAGTWLQLMDQYPSLRLVLALSPRFRRFVQEPDFKSRILALQQSGRLELALQLPNAPILPLLINTDAARNALPPHSLLPDPPFAFPDDADQIIAFSKADFARIWAISPKGLVLPYGAASPELLSLLAHAGMEWAVAALGAPSYGGAYQTGSLRVLDGAPAEQDSRFSVRILDERVEGNPALSLQRLRQWAESLEKERITPVLPLDPELPLQELRPAADWGGRTWTAADWSAWIGTPAKNSNWEWLRSTRHALEQYKNSGGASVQRLDAAFAQIYTAENANFFSGASEESVASAEDRDHEFRATLATVYRLIGQVPPDNLFSAQGPHPGTAIQPSSSTMSWETLPDGRGHLTFTDPANDDHGDGRLSDPSGAYAVPGAYDLRQFEVWIASDNLDFVVALATVTGTSLGTGDTPGPLIDIYMDINHQPSIGTLTLLPGRGAVVADNDAWEYGLCLSGRQAQFYRTRSNDSYELVTTLPLTVDKNSVHVSVPRALLRGGPQHWGYQVLVMSYDPGSSQNDPRPRLSTVASPGTPTLPIYDLLDPLGIPQARLLNDIEAGRRNDIPFIRLGN